MKVESFMGRVPLSSFLITERPWGTSFWTFNLFLEEAQMEKQVRLKLVKTEGGAVQVEVTQMSPPEKTKRAILFSVYYALVQDGGVSLEDFAKFRAEVEARDDLDGEGLAPKLKPYTCGRHVMVETYAGMSYKQGSFEGLKASLADLVEHSLITESEVVTLEANARELVPDMPENKVDAVPDPFEGFPVGVMVLDLSLESPFDDEKGEPTPEGADSAETPQED